MKKICSNCKQNIFIKDFYKNISKKDGRQSECKYCMSKYIIENKHRRSEYNKKYQVEHSQQIAKYQQKYRVNHMQEKVEYDKIYYDKHRQQRLEYQKEYIKTAEGKATNARRHHNRRTNMSNSLNTLTVEEFNCILFLQNYQCIGPNHEGSRYFDEVEPQKDHIVPVNKGGNFTKENIQVLCKSCNSKKGTKYIDYRTENHKEVMENIL